MELFVNQCGREDTSSKNTHKVISSFPLYTQNTENGSMKSRPYLGIGYTGIFFSSQAKGRLTATGGSREPNMAGVTSSTLTGGRGRVLPPVVGVGVVWAKQEEGKAGGKDYSDWQL